MSNNSSSSPSFGYVTNYSKNSDGTFTCNLISGDNSNSKLIPQTQSSSVFPAATVTSTGGGYGAKYQSGNPGTAGGPGGSGGGGTAGELGGAGTNYPGPTQQGFPGGAGNNGTPDYRPGGGGGAGQQGQVNGGGAGAQVPSTFQNPLTFYDSANQWYLAGGGGGGGGSYPAGSGGSGGGGGGSPAASPYRGSNGKTNTGGGGGGAATPGTGGTGGSGIVIIAYPS